MNGAFARSLRDMARALESFSEPASGGLTWNGMAYVSGSHSSFDPFAAKWWAILTTLADFLEAQETHLSKAQRDYLDRLLFGGMGSFNDFVLDESQFGSKARQANAELVRLRKRMFEEYGRSLSTS